MRATLIDMRYPMHTDRAIRLRFLFAMAFLPSLAALGAQQEGPTGRAQQADPTAEAAVPRPSLSVNEIQLQLKQVQDATDVTEDAKSKAVGFYTQAVQQLELVEQWTKKAAEYDAERQKAPETLKTIQSELMSALGEPTPEVPAGATRTELEQRLRQTQSDLDAEKRTLADWERERDRRTTRRKEIPELLAAAKARLQTLTETPDTPDAGQPTAVRLAQQAFNQIRRLAIEREVEAYNSELLSYDARRDSIQARLDRSSRRVSYFEKLLSAWQTLVQESARRESEFALREAREQLKRAHPALRPLAEEREQLAVRAKELQVENKEVDTSLTETEALLNQVSQDFEKLTRRVNATGLTNAIGQLLRKHRGSLPSLRQFERNLRQRKDRISAAQLAMMEVEDRRGELMNVDALVAKIMTSIDTDTGEDQRAMIREATQEAIATLRAEADGLLKDNDRLFDKLVDLDSKERELVKKIGRLAEYVDEKVLWIKSSTLPSTSDIRHGREALAWLLDPSNWREVLKSVGGTFRASTGPTVAGLVALIAIWLASMPLVRFVRESGEAVSKPSKDSMGRTVGVLCATVGLALRWPAALWFAGWVISSPYEATDFSKAIANGLNKTALILLTLQSLRQLARPNGLAEKHFQWNARSLVLLRRHLVWLTAVLVPTFLVFSALAEMTIDAGDDSLGRLTFVLAFCAITLFVQRVLRPAGPILRPMLRRKPGSWLHRLRHICFFVALSLPISLVIAAVVGYYYTSLHLGTRLIESVWLLLGLTVLRELAKRWLTLQTRRRGIAESRERAALKEQQKETAPATPVKHEVVAIPDEKLDASTINKQTLQLVRVVLAVVAIGFLWVIWAETLPALGVFREVTLWTITEATSETVPTADGGSQINEYAKTIPVTLADVGLAGLVILIAVVAAKNIPGLLEVTVLEKLPLDRGGRFAITTMVRYAIGVIGIFMMLSLLGVSWSSVQWLVAAMTVGLGFGLQEIFANFVSGLIILFERPIRIGDTVTVGDISGDVTQIRIRATTIIDWDRKELVIPNKEFVTGQVINWSLTDPVLRVKVPVGIAYGSDTDLAESILHRVARATEHVLSDPEPKVLFLAFGESSLTFELRVFVPSIDYFLKVKHALHKAIDSEFRQAGIEIAFPQRDIHVRSIRDALPVIDQKADVLRQEDA